MIERIGKQFGYWTVIRRDTNSCDYRWICRCACGTEKSVQMSGLLCGKSMSCGCGVHQQGNLKHGMYGKGVYVAWGAMRQRCLDKDAPTYPHYGGRGIKICNYILSSPFNLFTLIGDRPKGLTLDREDNDRNYSCGSCEECLINGWNLNVRWATRVEQARNRSITRKVTIDGVTLPRSEWAEIARIPYDTFKSRIRSGWPERDLLLPLNSIRIKHPRNVKGQFAG